MNLPNFIHIFPCGVTSVDIVTLHIQGQRTARDDVTLAYVSTIMLKRAKVTRFLTPVYQGQRTAVEN